MDNSHVTHGILFPRVNVFKQQSDGVCIFKNGLHENFSVIDLNLLADNDRGNTISWLVNGRANGFNERIEYRQKLKEIMKIVLTSRVVFLFF
ncbi:hypothetical protein [Cricetibacter osteomyelitidis]|uniref:hypothetical protein n=1 Tax=Cricetibacter osteomyelitidis TaxID=1521931 RepID=UPI00104B6172|nr:hypothetical protein [Cricetibacter osteomyelitidis]